MLYSWEDFISKFQAVFISRKGSSSKIDFSLKMDWLGDISSPITSWEIDGETVETVADFIFGDSKITADGDCSHEMKRRLLL